MKILLVSSFLPYPLYSGGHIRLYNLIKLLSKKHEVVLVCEKRDYQSEEDIKELEKICRGVRAVPRKKQWSLANILKTGFSLSPFLVTGHTNSKLKKAIEEELEKEKFDLVHVETFYVMQNLPERINLPVVLAEHNAEYLVYRRFADRMSLFLRPLFRLDVWKMKRWERNCWKKAAQLVAVSEEEGKMMEGINKNVSVIPNGADTENFKFQTPDFKFQKAERRVLFIGDFRWLQNRDALGWILKDIWPKINYELGVTSYELKLWVVGRKIPGVIKKLTKNEDVVFDENAPKETWEIFKQADILLAPIRVGGGTSFKILEAMASGVPVVTTGLGIEGINAINGKEAMIQDSAERMAESVVNLLDDANLYDIIAANARRLIEQKYDWKKIAKKLETVYESAKISHD
ncbi:glycosyltransferase family 4 protein [Patescibacteria group bacterium]|nr:glycosyltransferase family 4 protein [Patescibacteria group bacterium]